MRLLEALEQVISRPASDAEAARDFLDDHRAGPRYAMGKNADSMALHRLVPLDGIIDDYAGPGELWNDIPLIHADDACKQGRVANCSTSIRPLDARDRLRAVGFDTVASLSGIVQAAEGSLPLPSFVEAQRREMRDHPDAWQAILNGLADDASKSTLLDVLRFRLTADPVYMRDYRVRIQDQYFEDFMAYGNEVFVDAGGFDGDTAEAFATRYPDYRKILLFEPSERNMALARSRLAGFRDIAFHSFGLSDAPGRLRFDPGSGSASAISDSGAGEIVVDTLDAAIHEPVTVIKMDLEGWELHALEGSRRHLRDDRPKLAIAAYHDAPDLRRIHAFVSSFGHDYRVFLRHYTQGWSETVLFFKPRE